MNNRVESNATAGRSSRPFAGRFKLFFSGAFLRAFNSPPPSEDVPMDTDEALTRGLLKRKAEQGPAGRVMPAKHPRPSDHHLDTDADAPFVTTPPNPSVSDGGLHQESVLDEQGPSGRVMPAKRPRLSDHYLETDAPFVTPPPNPSVSDGGLHQESVLDASGIASSSLQGSLRPFRHIPSPSHDATKDNRSTDDADAVQVCLTCSLVCGSYLNMFCRGCLIDWTCQGTTWI